MPILSGCCCFRTLKRGSRASAIFTFVIAACNIIIDCDSLVRLHHLDRTMEPQEKFVYLPPGIIPLMYIELVLSLLTIGLGICLLIGINLNYDGGRFIHVWVYGIIADRVYDLFLGIYILAWIGGHRFLDVFYIVPQSFVIIYYWIVNSLILLAAILCVLSYWQQLQDELYGKQRRVAYYKTIANIRTAALSGAVTPMRSHYGSQSTFAASQAAINPAFSEKY